MHSHAARDAIHSIGSDFNLRVPRAFKQAALVGVMLLVVEIGIRATQTVFAWEALLVILGVFLLLPAFLVWLVVTTTRTARLRVRDRMVKSVKWRGDERVLDVGTGSGILLIGCASHLKEGKADGIDIWEPNSGGGTADNFWRNVREAGIESKTTLHNVDAREMTFADSSFDVLVSSLAMHHIGRDKGGLEQAVNEMLRVLKPGGAIRLYDVQPMIQTAADILQRAGYRCTLISSGHFFSYLMMDKVA